ncbi:hypothetical protein [Streptomyces echinatus]|uniref:hypothetical protein n=1 Tax=Streptomyces echinatus TaxID=67293 RepID=UPI003801D099
MRDGLHILTALAIDPAALRSGARRFYPGLRLPGAQHAAVTAALLGVRRPGRRHLPAPGARPRPALTRLVPRLHGGRVPLPRDTRRGRAGDDARLREDVARGKFIARTGKRGSMPGARITLTDEETAEVLATE